MIRFRTVKATCLALAVAAGTLLSTPVPPANAGVPVFSTVGPDAPLSLTGQYLLGVIAYYCYLKPTLGGVSSLAPSQRADAWDRAFKVRFRALGMDSVDCIHASTNLDDTAVAVLSNQHVTIIAFRGTETNGGVDVLEKNFLTDADSTDYATCIFQSALPGIVIRPWKQHSLQQALSRAIDQFFAASILLGNRLIGTLLNTPDDGPVIVHRGFFHAYETVQGRLFEVLLQPDHANRPVIVTGHSLGGSLAEICAWDLAMEGRAQVRGVCTFGAPRPGKVSFRASYQRTLAGVPTIRVVDDYDLVPTLPPFAVMGYCQVGFSERLLPGGKEDDYLSARLDLTQSPFQPDSLFPRDEVDYNWPIALGHRGLSDHLMPNYLWRLYVLLPPSLRVTFPQPPPLKPARG